MTASMRHVICRPAVSITGAECRELFDGGDPSVASAAMWHDYQTTSGDRLTLSFAMAAVKSRCGAGELHRSMQRRLERRRGSPE